MEAQSSRRKDFRVDVTRSRDIYFAISYAGTQCCLGDRLFLAGWCLAPGPARFAMNVRTKTLWRTTPAIVLTQSEHLPRTEDSGVLRNPAQSM